MTSKRPPLTLLCAVALAFTVGGFLACKKKKDNPVTSTTAAGTVTLTSSACGASPAGTVTITGASSDATDLAAIEFLLDGNVLVSDNSSPYQATWDTAGDASGVHNITALVVNSAGQKGVSSTACAVTLAKRVFVHDPFFAGADSFGGIAGADTLCQTAANNAGLGGIWKVWMSDSNTDAINRIADVGPWYWTDKTTLVAASKAALASGSIQNPIRKYQNGTDTGVGLPTWTGTLSSGLRAPGPDGNCSDWTNAIGGTALVGDTFATSGDWTNESPPFGCGGNAHFYCFEQ